MAGGQRDLAVCDLDAVRCWAVDVRWVMLGGSRPFRASWTLGPRLITTPQFDYQPTSYYSLVDVLSRLAHTPKWAIETELTAVGFGVRRRGAAESGRGRADGNVFYLFPIRFGATHAESKA